MPKMIFPLLPHVAHGKRSSPATPRSHRNGVTEKNPIVVGMREPNRFSNQPRSSLDLGWMQIVIQLGNAPFECFRTCTARVVSKRQPLVSLAVAGCLSFSNGACSESPEALWPESSFGHHSFVRRFFNHRMSCDAIQNEEDNCSRSRSPGPSNPKQKTSTGPSGRVELNPAILPICSNPIFSAVVAMLTMDNAWLTVDWKK